MCKKQVKKWLVLLTMEQYMPIFIERGYVTIADCQTVINSDLIMLGVDDYSHRKLLLIGVQLLVNSPQLFACSGQCEDHFTAFETDSISPNIWDICTIDLTTDSEDIQDFLAPSPPPKRARPMDDVFATLNISTNMSYDNTPHFQYDNDLCSMIMNDSNEPLF